LHGDGSRSRRGSPEVGVKENGVILIDCGGRLENWVAGGKGSGELELGKLGERGYGDMVRGGVGENGGKKLGEGEVRQTNKGEGGGKPRWGPA
jgi:hypothetical protein